MTRGETVEAKLKRPGKVATDDLSYGGSLEGEQYSAAMGDTGKRARERKKKKKEKKKKERKRRELGRSQST
jgi:hypothetical protein